LAGNTDGQLLFYPNIGTDAAPQFDTWQAVQAGGVAADLAGIPRARPSIADLNADGLPDLLVGPEDGFVRWYRAESWQTPRFDAATPGDPGTLDRHVFRVAAATWQNPTEPADVNRDGAVVPLDALTIINPLGSLRYADADGRLRRDGFSNDSPFLDVSGDGYCSPIDALTIINRLTLPASAPAGLTVAAERGAPKTAMGLCPPNTSPNTCPNTAAKDSVFELEASSLRSSF
jgi:hypothetical protein